MINTKSDDGLEENENDINIENRIFRNEPGTDAASEQQQFEKDSANPEEAIEHRVNSGKS